VITPVARRSKLCLTTAAVAIALLAAACSSGGGSGSGSTTSSAAERLPVRMAFSIPGPNLYFNNYENALNNAATSYHLAGHDYVVGSVWSLNAQNVTLDALEGQDYNALGIFPGDPVGTNTQLRLMQSHIKGFEAILVGGCTNDPTPALFCIATDVEGAAYQATEALIKKMGGHGEIAHLTSELTDPNTILREDGVNKAVAQTDGAVKVVQVIGNTDTPDAATSAVQSLLAARGNTLGGIVATAWYPTAALAAAMQANPQYRHIVVVGEDAAQQTQDGIKNGYIYASSYQNSYGQAAVAAYVLDKIVGDGCTIRSDFPWQKTSQTNRFLNSGFGLITKANIAQYYGRGETLPAQTAALMTQVNTKMLNCPKS